MKDIPAERATSTKATEEEPVSRETIRPPAAGKVREAASATPSVFTNSRLEISGNICKRKELARRIENIYKGVSIHQRCDGPRNIFERRRPREFRHVARMARRRAWRSHDPKANPASPGLRRPRRGARSPGCPGRVDASRQCSVARSAVRRGIADGERNLLETRRRTLA